MQQHSNIELRVVALLADKAAHASIVPERGICAVEFDARGGIVHFGQAVEHLTSDDAHQFSEYLIDNALDMLRVNPSIGILLIQADSPTIVSAFYIPDATLRLIDSPSATRH